MDINKVSNSIGQLYCPAYYPVVPHRLPIDCPSIAYTLSARPGPGPAPPRVMVSWTCQVHLTTKGAPQGNRGKFNYQFQINPELFLQFSLYLSNLL